METAKSVKSSLSLAELLGAIVLAQGLGRPRDAGGSPAKEQKQ